MSRLTAADWTVAGLKALSRGGLGAVAVEPLAAELGASKGSFYWHFGRRDDLVAAVIERWESGTERLIDDVQRVGTSAEARLRALFDRVFADHAESATELALMASADDARVAAALARVTSRRVDYLTDLMQELGLGPAVARRRAAFAYSAFVGQLQLRAAVPDELERSTGSLPTYAEEIVALLTAPPPRPPRSTPRRR